MKFFGRKNPSTAGQGARGPVILENTRLLEIWKQTSLPRAEFDKTYKSLLDRSVQYLRAEPSNGWEHFRADEVEDKLVRDVLRALRVRKGRLVPKGLPAEDSARVAEVMSFALAVCITLQAVGEAVGTSTLRLDTGGAWGPTLGPAPSSAVSTGRSSISGGFGLLLFSSLLSDQAQAWLYQEPIAMFELVRFFDSPKTSELKEIARLAGDAAGISALIPNSSKRESRAKVGQKVGLGRQYFEWLDAAIESGEVVINQPESFVHGLPNGALYLVVPNAFEAFAKEKTLRVKAVENRVLKMKAHRSHETGKTHFSAKVAKNVRVKGFVFRRSRDLIRSVLIPPSTTLNVMFDD